MMEDPEESPAERSPEAEAPDLVHADEEEPSTPPAGMREEFVAKNVGKSPPMSICKASRTNPRHELEELDENVLREMLLKASPKYAEPFDMSQITRNVSIGRAARREMDVASSSYGEAGQLTDDGGFRRPSRNSHGGMAGGGPGLPNGQSAHGGGGGGGSNGQRSAGATATGVAAFFGPLGGLIGLSSPPPAASGSARASGTGLTATGGQAGQGGQGGGGGGPLPPALSTTSSVGVGTCYDAELARQRAAVAAIEDDVEEECKVNRELATRITERLDNSCKILEGLAALLSALGAAEGAYATAMAAAARVRLVGLEADDGELRAAGEALLRVPSVIDQAHRPLQGTLTGLSKEVTALLGRYRAAAREVTSDTAAAQRHIDTIRKQLQSALADHGAACRGLEGVLADRGAGRPTRAPEADPWATEGRLVLEQTALQTWQDRERAALRKGFQQVTDLEQQRLELVKAAMTSAVDSYRAALLPLQHDLHSMNDVLQAIQPEVKLSTLRDMAATATRTAAGLGARQAECLHSVCHELFCSPEISRQGDLQVWEPATERWRKCHFVLTRAGYLHWFPKAEDVRPLDGLALARCAFEAGKAPRFNIIETAKGGGWLGGIRGRRLSFQAASVEECCEWAIAIREAIAVAEGKQLAFEEEEGQAGQR
ncbi:hypothetical protein HXX76_002910 [Chlamydomonas incerta]|uniref:PH domain-containing protein n=1 Tax=Chlamydomonas incerta TaxID=51695 RepID=A0A835TEW8_CHLIN|nr:hypothetical protein HXX76_002910 [Chlamydomonas incerta]|eukprot:KAG2442831.1 hypothetical protein HXX76_002910 [Chlamydomonas incerta]